MLIIVLVERNLVGNVNAVAVSSAGCGIMGMMGNKGAVAVRLGYLDGTLCFVNAHLAADTSQVDRRNQDYQEICKRLIFTSVPLPAPIHSTSNASLAAVSEHNEPLRDRPSFSGHGDGVFQFDHVFFFGDLNYRIALPEPEIKGLIKRGDFTSLLGFDQLNVERRAQRVLDGFLRAADQFPPNL